MVTIGAIIISYNEIDIVPVTAPAIINSCDSVVVVDMGSDDGTIEYWQDNLKNADLLVNYPREDLFRFGFAHARNYGAHHCSSDWLFAVDCDEFIIESQLSDVKEIISNTSHDVFGLKRANYARSSDFHLSNVMQIIDQCPKQMEVHRRLYRNKPRVRFEGTIHEELWIGEENSHSFAPELDLCLHHLSEYKANIDPYLKFGFYSYLTLRAIEFPGFRYGTNSYWFTEFPLSNMDTMMDAATKFCAQNGLSVPNEDNVRAQLVKERG